MRVNRIEDLPPESARAVIINVGTELVSTLALASALAHSSMPILVINCDPTPESSTHFDKLAAEWDFDLLEVPRRSHGMMLDRLFRQIKAEGVLLLDSDAEIRDPNLIGRLREYLAVKEGVFGAGFVHGPVWLAGNQGFAPKTALYQERPWIPCVMFRSSHVREALAAGLSFEPRVIYNDFMFSQAISKQLAKRFQNWTAPPSRTVRRLPEGVRSRLRSSTLPWLRWARRDFYGLRPNYVYCDTGAAIYQWLKYEREKIFAGESWVPIKHEVKHYSGVTRAASSPHDPTATQLSAIEAEVRDRLRTEYGVEPMAV